MVQISAIRPRNCSRLLCMARAAAVPTATWLPDQGAEPGRTPLAPASSCYFRNAEFYITCAVQPQRRQACTRQTASLAARPRAQHVEQQLPSRVVNRVRTPAVSCYVHVAKLAGRVDWQRGAVSAGPLQRAHCKHGEAQSAAAQACRMREFGCVRKGGCAHCACAASNRFAKCAGSARMFGTTAHLCRRSGLWGSTAGGGRGRVGTGRLALSLYAFAKPPIARILQKFAHHVTLAHNCCNIRRTAAAIPLAW